MMHDLLPVLLGTILASAGQILFKLGAVNNESLLDYFNLFILAGLFSYFLGTVLWIYSLSRLHLTAVYPFSALTFVIVCGYGFIFLKEPFETAKLVGILFILAGLVFITK